MRLFVVKNILLNCLLVYFIRASFAQQNGQVRLVDGRHSREGRVEVYFHGSWGTVCDDDWDVKDAQVVCRQLNFGAHRVAAYSSSLFRQGQTNQSIWLDDVACTGAESSLLSCRARPVGTHDCSHSEDAGVRCDIYVVRLVNGSHPWEGRVELNLNGTWGTVCDDGWDDLDAGVVCRQLGYLSHSYSYAAYSSAYFGQGQGQIWLDDVQCTGSEHLLVDCPRVNTGASGIGRHNCSHSDDASVMCKAFEVSPEPGQTTDADTLAATDVLSSSAVSSEPGQNVTWRVTKAASLAATGVLSSSAANINTRHDVTCGETEMSFDIALPADVTIPQKVTLSDPRCAVTGGPHRLQGQTALNACGTTVAFLNDSVVFSNEIFLNPDSNSTANGIVIPIHCHYNISYDLRLSYLPIVRQVLFTEEGVGQFGFQMQQFQDPQYSVAVDAASYPLRTIPSQEIYVQLSLRDLGLRTSVGRLAYGMDVERCLASPLASVTDARLREHEDLILEGCPASGKVHLHRHNTSASGSDYFRFSFHGVTFSSDPADPTRSFAGLVYVHCHVTLCPQGQCRADQQPCSPAGVGQRKKRAATWQSQAAGHQLSTGPLLVLAATEDLATSYNPAVIALSVVAAVACLAVVVVVVAWRRGVRPAKGGFQLVKVDEQE